MDDSTNPYSPTGGPSTQQAEDASVNPIDAQTGSANTVAANLSPVADNPIVGPHNQRILARHIVSGASRGNQTTTGQNIINDPITNNPVITTSGPQQNTVFSDPTTQTPRVVEGLLPDGTYGMWVSKPGMDVTTATATDLIFNSSQNVFKIVGSNTVKVVSPATTFTSNQYTSATSSIPFPHNLGYLPAILGFVSYTGFYNQLPYSAVGGSGTTALWYNAFVAVDAVNVYVEQNVLTFNQSEGSSPLTIKYYLLQETAN